MRFRNVLLVVLVIVVLTTGIDSARDKSRKKNRDKGRSTEQDSALDDDRGRGLRGEGLGGAERDREREKERERLLDKGDRKKEEESSEEKDEDKKEKNSTKEIVVLEARKRRSKPFYKPNTINHRFRYRRFPASEQGVGSVQLSKSKELNDGRSILLDEVQNKKPHHNSRSRRTLKDLVKTQEINDGEQQPLENRPSQSEQRNRRTIELAKTQEINDGEQKPLDKKPSQTHQHRLKRWPLPGKGKTTRNGGMGRKMRKPDAKKTVKHRAVRMRRADEGANPVEDAVEAKKQERKDSSDSSSSESAPKPKSRRSFNTAELIPRGKPSPYDTQSEEVMERDKTLRSIYPSQSL